MTTILSLKGQTLLDPAGFRRWVLGTVGLVFGGYVAITALSVWQFGLTASYVPRMAFATLACGVAWLMAWRSHVVLASAVTLLTVWTEVQIGFLTNSVFPAPGMLVLPVIITGVGLLLGSRVGLLATVVTVLCTTLTHRLGPLATTGFDANSVFWLTMHAISMVTAWALTALSLSGIEQVFQRLASSDMDLADTIRFSPDGILILDEAGRVVLSNPGAEMILGLARAEIVGADIHALLPELPATTLADPSITAAQGDLTQLVVPAGDGTPRHLEASCRRMERDRRQLLLRDVTRRVLAELRRSEIDARLAHAQRLEAVGQLAGGLSHDFNNILTAVSGSAYLLRREQNPAERIALLDEIVAARDRGAALTRQLLAFARRDVVQPRVIDVADHVTALHRLLQRVAGDQVRMQYALAADARVLLDPTQFEQALVNLVANARDAMPEGGTCRIACAIVSSGTECEQVRISVSDTGVGMTSLVAQRAFEPFFTTKPRGQGTGLGLAAVHGMVTQGNGEVQIASTPGHGTQVTLEFPRATAPVAPVPLPIAEPAPASGGATILVAEDDDGTRRIVYRILRDAGYHVLLASDGLEAWEMVSAAGSSIDLLLTDVMMPGLSGPALAERVRTAAPHLPVLFMTGYTEDHVRTLGGSRLQGDVIAKPFSASDLLQRITVMLRLNAVPLVQGARDR